MGVVNGMQQCDFCLESEDEIDYIIVGQNGAICDRCVRICVNEIHNRMLERLPTPPATSKDS